MKMQSYLKLLIFICFIKTIICLNIKKDCQCKINPSLRIIGGRKAHHLSYPWILSLSQIKDDIPDSMKKYVSKEKKIGYHSCGGSIINEYWILTAAHCVYNTTIYAGYGNDNDLVKIFDSGRIESIKTIVNPYYKRYDDVNDIALVKLKEPIKFTNYVKPVCFSKKSLKVYPRYLEHAGWGSTVIFEGNIKTKEYSKSKIPQNLKELFLVDQSDYFSDCKFNKKIICAKGIKKGESSCKGDSGSPIHFTTNGKTYIVGLTSHGAEKYFDGELIRLCLGTTVYTRVDSYINWIKEHVGDDICHF